MVGLLEVVRKSGRRKVRKMCGSEGGGESESEGGGESESEDGNKGNW